MRQSIYRLARGARYSRWQAFRAAFFNAELSDRTEELQTETDANRARLWKTGDENIKRIILSDLVAELDRLVVHGDGDPAAEFAYLDRIRRIDPDLAERVSLRHIAEMNDHLARHGLD
jgi:hypothetical protein